MVTWPQMVRRMQRWCPCWRCAGVLGLIAPASSPTLRCCCCRGYAGIIALVVWALLPSLHWHYYPCCLCSPPALQTGVCPVMKQLQHTLASLSALRHCCFWRCASIIALVAWAFLPRLRWQRRPWHTRVSTSIMNWHLPSHDAVATHCW